MTETVQIYALIAPPMYPDPRYVGVTKRELDTRLWEHLSRARKGEGTRKARWIRKCERLGLTVEIVLLNVVSLTDWEEAERFYVGQYPNLTNSCAGGYGMLDPTPETRAKMSRASSAIRKPWLWTPDAIGRSVTARRGKPQRPRTNEEKLAAAERSRGRTHSHETKERLRAAALARCAEPDYLAFLRQLNDNRPAVSPATRAKQSSAGKARWARERAAKVGQ